MLFRDMPLIEPVLQALGEEGYTNPTPIQQQAIPAILQRKDLLGVAQTGTGKTAAFTIPVLQLMQEDALKEAGKHAQIHTLILTPTRELAIQIGESIAAYGRHLRLRHLVVFGGVSQHPQTEALRRGVDILVATPGRLLDLIQQGYITLRHIRFFILDEADRMLDMGFVHDVRRVISHLPAKRQTLFFSATMPKEIQDLANVLLTNPVKVEVTPASSTADIINQSLYHVDKASKFRLLQHLLENPAIQSLLVFTQMKHAADKLAKQLVKCGIQADAIHGNKSQNARQRALENFKNRNIRVLVATDIAARGIDIDDLAHVLNFDLPNVPETYVHRIGRTGRAGASGTAISFCDHSEMDFLKDIQKLIRKSIPLVSGHPFEGMAPAIPSVQAQPQRPRPAAGNRKPVHRNHRPKFNRRMADQ
ncbi:MAG TPA: DEAD/DEAH box helicase [Chitinophagaceae bacterium]|nr:DEAD/DEAH box helicase [Chitinophagaceae bacterium]HRF26864.1 DEAD/DEAH box helicase [Ferruginibacter sp.]